MASKKIKGITIEIGADTTKLGDALKESETKSASLQKELNQVNRALKFNPDNIDLINQKQQIMAELAQETNKKLQAMEEAQAQVNEQVQKGDIAQDVYREFQRELITTQSKLENLNQQIEESNKTMNDSQDDADDLADSIEDVGDASKESEGGFTIMKGALADLVSNAIQSAISAVGDLVGAIFELDDATKEYRSMQAKLASSAERNGYSVEYAKKMYEGFYNLVGDDQMATNAITNLMGLGVETETLNSLAYGAKGVWASYGDSIPIESLTEAINETIQVGKVTGVFADTVNWVNTSLENSAYVFGEGTKAQEAYNQAIADGENKEDAFSKALEATSDSQERAEIVARFLNDTYGDSIDTYVELNDEMIQTNKAELQMKDTQSKLGEAIAPVNRAFSEMKSKALEKLVPLVESLSKKFMDLYNYLKEHPTLLQVLTALAIALATAFGILATALGIQALISGITKAFALLNATLLANPVMLVIAVLSALVVAILYLWNNCEAFRNGVIAIYNVIESTIVNGFNWIVQFISSLGATLYGIGVSIFTSLKNGFDFVWTTLVEFFTVTIPNIINSIADIDLWQTGWDIINSLWGGLKDIWGSVSEWFESKMAWVSDSLSWILGKKAEADSASSSIRNPKKEKTDGSHANGLAYVPFDGYIAELHKGERVLTAEENKAMTSGSAFNVTQNIYVPTENPREIERQAKRQLVSLARGY